MRIFGVIKTKSSAKPTLQGLPPIFIASSPQISIMTGLFTLHLQLPIKYATEIANAKADLEKKIANELATLKNKKEKGGEEIQGAREAELSIASHTEISAS